MQIYVNVHHCRTLGYCVFAVRRFCTRYDLDFKKLCNGTMPVEEIEATGQAIALHVAAVARKEASNGGR